MRRCIILGLIFYSMAIGGEMCAKEKTEGLFIHLGFDEGKAGSIFKEGDKIDDKSGKNNVGVVHGNPKLMKCDNILVLGFKEGDYIEILHNDDFENLSSISIEGWFYPGDLSFRQILVTKWQNSPAENSFVLYSKENGLIEWGVCWEKGKYSILRNGCEFTPETWNYIAGTWDGKEGILKLYKNGELMKEEKTASGVTLNNAKTPLLIGTHNDKPGQMQNFTGAISGIKVWNRVLSVDEVKKAYLQEEGKYSAKIESIKTHTPAAIPIKFLEKKTIEDIGSRLELFVDDWLIDKMENLTLKLHSPIPKEIAIFFDAPWEGDVSAYHSIIKDNDRYRLYYRGWAIGQSEFTCYAESKNGINWTKPALRIHSFKGSGENNIIWAGPGGMHNFAPFRDGNPAAPENERYKAVAGGPLIALSSPDGIHWKKMQDKPIITKGVFDSLNTAFWDAERKLYFAFIRDFREGIRDIRYCISKDFLNWTAPEWLDYGDAPREHLYTNAITPYFRAPHIFLGLPARFVPERKAIKDHPEMGVSDALFMSSRDGVHWHRFKEALIRPGLDRNNWTDRNIYPAWGIVPTGKEEISLYYSEHYRHSTNHLRRATLRTDGFVSVHAEGITGEFLTRPFTFKGENLIINYSTSAAGSILIEIQDADRKPISGYNLSECLEIFSDEIERIVSWKNGSDVGGLAGTPIRLKFVMKDADLYSIRFQP